MGSEAERTRSLDVGGFTGPSGWCRLWVLFLFLALVLPVPALGRAFGTSGMVPKYQPKEYKNRIAREMDCGNDEYYENGICCENCPAGTHVVEPCRSMHEQGKCNDCRHGEEFTAYANGLVKCLTCKHCRQDEEEVSPCTSIRNTVCRCRPSTFCPRDQPCEQCYMCTEKCPEGKRIIHNCNATSDIVCEVPLKPQVSIHLAKVDKPALENAGSLQDSTVTRASDSSLATPLLSENPPSAITQVRLNEVGVHVPENSASEQNLQAIGLKETRSNVLLSRESPVAKSARKQDGDKGAEREDSSQKSVNCPEPAKPPDKPVAAVTGCDNSSNIPVSVKDYSDDSRCYYSFIKEIPTNQWRKFMRTMQLTDNEIDAVSHDHRFDVDEQHYQMLSKWKNKFGKEVNITNLLEGLKEIGLAGCAENVLNDLIAEGICSVDKHLLDKD
ncbi:tumor necrosis factor receptor superfamily member 10B-like isoform X2 [Rhinatrema bivittatum]|uniref:tumor necrosis factor receptor superfamily member 10B-like isoform X2 n=1 Tax=Rhinatrema bivittatum TaxID=194408 RepID=UPI00112B14C9|nr:tumor necrosis factor receptor superfamily member 10B-like isoform X2 [Rhinatrema bivittatum]